MTSEEIIKSLNKQFITRYGKRISDLNKNVYPSAKNDKGSFEVPVPTLGAGGGTLITGKDTAFKLENPASVTVAFKNMEPQQLIYRIAIPFEESKIAAEKPEYFNYLFDAIVNKALGNYAATVGQPDIVRFGTCSISFTRPGDDSSVFQQLENAAFELRSYGEWASNKEDLT